MRHIILAAALPLIGALAIASEAQAYTFSLSGDGMTASGWFTVGPDSHIGSEFGTGTTPNTMGPGYFGLADPTNALAITSAGGTFSDSNIGISDVAITGVIPNNYLPHFADDPNIPYSFSWWTGMGFPGAYPSTLLSYDNLFYTGAGSPLTCIGVPGGGVLDNYGVLLKLANGDVLDIYSDGGSGSTIYGAAVADSASILDYEDTYPGNPDWSGPPAASLLTFTAAPELSTWAMMVLGFAGLGFVGYSSARKGARVAAWTRDPETR